MRTRLVTGCLLLCLAGPALRGQDVPAVFRQPMIVPQYARLQAEVADLMKKGDLAAAKSKCEEAIRLAPQYPGGHYNLACILALQGKKDDAFASLDRAIAAGFAASKHLEEDKDLESLRKDERFAKAVDAASKAKPLLLWSPAKIEPAKAEDGQAIVSAKNTAWDVRHGFFVSVFDIPADFKEKPIYNGGGEAGELLKKWYAEGTAAGNVGDLYDNHDEDHSNMHFARFPQLTRIEFDKELKGMPGRQYHRGLQTHFFFGGVALGNASVAVTGGPFWRSMTRLAYTDPRAIQFLYNQYTNSHIYLYPEHRDHDPGHNGQGGGFGDVFPANTPYVITSQGSSGSDIVFLDAVASTLAAFRPDVKKRLVEENALMPTVQMIFRNSNKNVKGDDDYLSGKAHPSVFEGNNLDVVRMVKTAHEITPDTLPPLVRLKVVEEDRPVPGRDYFDAEPRGERLFDTPCAIARVMRSTSHTRRMVVSAEDSECLHKGSLDYKWVLLRGDPKHVTIKPLGNGRTRAEITVRWQERRPVEEGSKIESNRIDIGVFVHSGKCYSAPAFITFLGLDNQKRTYDEKNRIAVVDYADEVTGKNYVDPMVDLKKDWRDEYRYAADGTLIGWTRKRGKEEQEFTADGALVMKKDAKGRAEQARTVRYVPRAAARNQAPVLEQQEGDEVLHYEYASDEDRVGKVARREKVTN